MPTPLTYLTEDIHMLHSVCLECLDDKKLFDWRFFNSFSKDHCLFLYASWWNWTGNPKETISSRRGSYIWFAFEYSNSCPGSFNRKTYELYLLTVKISFHVY